MFKKHFKRIFFNIFRILIFTLALYVLYRELKLNTFKELKQHLHQIPSYSILAVLLLTFLSYFIFMLYDFFAFKYVGLKIDLKKISFTSFLSYAFGNNISLSGFSSAAIRLKLYSLWEVPLDKILKIITFCYSSFWFGLIAISGVIFICNPIFKIEKFNLLIPNLNFLGYIFILFIFIYLLFSFKQKVKIMNKEIILPKLSIAIAQIIFSSLDWIISGLILYILLPNHSVISFITFLGIFLIAQVFGIISNIPGGIGVFDTIIVTALSSNFESYEILGTLIVYRLIYYILPLIIAIFLFTYFEFFANKKMFGTIKSSVKRITFSFIPKLFAISIFFSGLILLISGSIPSQIEKIKVLKTFLPIAFIEISHFLGSIVGVLLLILSIGIKRRLDSAYFSTIFFLILGIFFSLMKGCDYSEAILLTIPLLLIIPSKKYFYRKSSIFKGTFSSSWTLSIIIAVISSIWIGLFVYKNVDYSNELWWKFTFSHGAPSFLRASFGVILTILIFEIITLFNHEKRIFEKPNIEDILKVKSIINQSENIESNLALLGDKSFLFNEKNNAFVMYGISGKSVISMGDPVGPKEELSEIIWKFYEFCKYNSLNPVFYEIGKEFLNYYIDIGLTLIKIGEEAKVDIKNFTLEGSNNKKLRYTYSKLNKLGYTFEFIEKKDVAEILPVLKNISDKWLGIKNTKEKGFSLGNFNTDYLINFDFAVIKKDNEIVAFSNIFSTDQKKKLSIDLIRYLPDSADGMIEFLIINMLIYARDNNYEWFNLGIAPLSGIQGSENAPAWNKIAFFIFRKGEYFYNFSGLRNYKNKFNPIWEPKYIAFSGSFSLPKTIKDITILSSGGIMGVLKK